MAKVVATEKTSAIVQTNGIDVLEQRRLAEEGELFGRLLLEIRGDEDEAVEPFEIESPDDYVLAADLLVHVKGKIKEIEERRKLVTRPLNDALKAFREWYKPSLEVLGKAERALKRKIGDWKLEEARQEEAAVKAIAAAAQADDFEGAHEASLQLPDPVRAKGVSTREVWELDEDKLDMGLVPREFLQLDMSVVKEYIRGFKGRPKDQPGLVFKKRVEVRGSRG